MSGREREEISRGIAAGESARQLAKRLGRSPSTVSREITRNGYRAATAYGRGRRPKQAKLVQRAVCRTAPTRASARAASHRSSACGGMSGAGPSHASGHRPAGRTDIEWRNTSCGS
ncbi:helix-turn-helix domain-containing protein [Streptomyces nitrosporeus]|uniref:helix-turn-helix domain-containing protein n=1 Tax=Streptomyces nitrosporeus TaxID=28894 RepID=UPI00198A21E5|nr:hypothetical protein GCM10010327_57320 [Streptomyces nitrosporeus]